MIILGLSMIITGSIIAWVQLKEIKKLNEIIELLQIGEEIQKDKLTDNGTRYTIDELIDDTEHEVIYNIKRISTADDLRRRLDDE